jgi:hypothetical protein
MKKSIILICYFVITLTVITTAQPYKLDVLNQTYTEIEQDTLVFTEMWFNEIKEIPIGFDFNFYGQTFNKVTAWNESLFFDYDNESHFIYPFESFLCDRGIPSPGSIALSPITYVTEGGGGNQIFKFQVKNAGFTQGIADDFTNFQVWLYETSNIIELRYGETNIVSASPWQDDHTGPIVVLVESLDSELIILEGNPSAPNLTYLNPIDSTSELLGLTSATFNGLVYRFTPTLTSIKEDLNIFEVNIWPNPTSGLLNITSVVTNKEIFYSVFDTNGHTIVDKSIYKESINTSIWPKGYLIIQLSQNNQIRTFKILKQ